MPTNQLSADQIKQLASLGISIPHQNTKQVEQRISEEINNTTKIQPTTGQIGFGTTPSSQNHRLLPLLSISGLTMFSLGGLILFKDRNTASSRPLTPPPKQASNPEPTQVPKSIQHYLLASQQYFSQAIQLQQTQTSHPQITDLLNQSIISATEAIKNFPQDYRGYYQRAHIYQSLTGSQSQFLHQAVNDLAMAFKYNSSSAEITRELATLYAKTGDTNNTLNYLVQTITLEPTRAQNFYDLAKLQQQIGQLPAALETYNRLIPLVTDQSQKQQVEAEKQAIQNLLAQTSPSDEEKISQHTFTPVVTPTLSFDSPAIQASTESRVIIAAPETKEEIKVKDQTDTNALSGNNIINAGQKQVVITNDNITPASQIYLTITKGGKNQNLQVISKSIGTASIGLETDTSQDIEFKWWIIN